MMPNHKGLRIAENRSKSGIQCEIPRPNRLINRKAYAAKKLSNHAVVPNSNAF